MDMLGAFSIERKKEKKRKYNENSDPRYRKLCMPFYRTFIHVYFLSGLVYQLAYHYRGISTVR